MNLFSKVVGLGIVAMASLSLAADDSVQVWWHCTTGPLPTHGASHARNPVGPFELEIATVADQYRIRIHGLYGARRTQIIDVIAPTERVNAVGTRGESLMNYSVHYETPVGNLNLVLALSDSSREEPGFVAIQDGSKSSWAGPIACR